MKCPIMEVQCRNGVGGLIVLAVLIGGIAGCGASSSPSEETIRIHQFLCKGELSLDQRTCKGTWVAAGTYDFRLYFKERRAVIRVVQQDPNNFYLPLIQLDNCVFWDSKNWHCEYSIKGVSYQEWQMNDGHYLQTSRGTTAGDVFYYLAAEG